MTLVRLDEYRMKRESDHERRVDLVVEISLLMMGLGVSELERIRDLVEEASTRCRTGTEGSRRAP